jgi:hypothetical protein
LTFIARWGYIGFTALAAHTGKEVLLQIAPATVRVITEAGAASALAIETLKLVLYRDTVPRKSKSISSKIYIFGFVIGLLEGNYAHAYISRLYYHSCRVNRRGR